MSILEVSQFRISEQGAPMTVRLQAGEWLGIAGPSESNPSRLLAEFASKAPRGLRMAWIDPDSLSNRATIQNLAKVGGADRAARVLTALRLWEVRKQTVGSLNAVQRRAAALVPVLAEDHPVILAEESLDSLDPWVLPHALDELATHPALKITMSQRPDVLERCSRLVVLHDRGLRFDGAPSDLVRIIKPAAVEVETADPGAIAAIVAPLQLQVESSPGRLTIHTTEGQKLAAELCLRGYPFVKAITVRTPTLAEALTALIR